MTRRLVLLALLAIVAGVSAAYAGHEEQTLGVCANKGDGGMRLDLGSGCRPNELALELPSSATLRRSFVSRRDLHGEPLDVPDDPGPIHTMTVPDDGLFAYVATVEFASHDHEQRAGVDCELAGEFAVAHMGAETPMISSTVTMPLIGLGDGVTAEIRCADGGAGVVVEQVTMIAIPIDGLWDVSEGDLPPG